MLESEDPLELAQRFWKAMCTKDGMKIVRPMLSPDCYIKDGFGNDARGGHGSEAVSAKLTEISGKITGGAATFETDIPFRVMRSKVQVRFLTSAKVGWITISIGFALEFECGFIVKVVIMKNPGKGVFETDDTKEAPQIEPPVVLEPEVDDTSQESATKEEDIIPENMEISEASEVKNDEEVEDHSFYFGKFLGRARPVKKVEVEFDDLDGDASPVSLAETLHPPYLTSKPPQIPPTVVVTVVGCMHLKSPLKRVIEREVNAYVSVQMKGMPVIQSTPVASPGPNPMFSSSNKFVFEAPPTGGSIMFTVYDKKSVGDDLIIAEVWVPLASLATTSSSHSAPTAMSLPLHMFKQVSRFKKQVHRPSVASGSVADLSELEGEKVGQLDVQISKIDIMKWWALEELKARDDALDKKEAEEEAARQKVAAEAAAKKAAVEEQNSIAGLLKSGKTVDANIHNCLRCNEEFTFFKRKHHCRFCLRAVCDHCSPDEAMIDGGMHRCCKDCIKEQRDVASTEGGSATSKPLLKKNTAQSSGQNKVDDIKEKLSTNSSSTTTHVIEEKATSQVDISTSHAALAAADANRTEVVSEMNSSSHPQELKEVDRQVVTRVESTDSKWEPDDATEECRICKEEFTFFLRRRHHCRCCGRLVCGNCSPEEMMIAGMAERCCSECILKYGNNEDEDIDDKNNCFLS